MFVLLATTILVTSPKNYCHESEILENKLCFNRFKAR